MLRAWEIAKLEKELAERSRERQNKESELEIELARYKQEVERIPEICRHRPCVFEVSECAYRNHKNVWEWVLDWRRKCPQICPKWRGGGI